MQRQKAPSISVLKNLIFQDHLYKDQLQDVSLELNKCSTFKTFLQKQMPNISNEDLGHLMEHLQIRKYHSKEALSKKQLAFGLVLDGTFLLCSKAPHQKQVLLRSSNKRFSESLGHFDLGQLASLKIKALAIKKNSQMHSTNKLNEEEKQEVVKGYGKIIQIVDQGRGFDLVNYQLVTAVCYTRDATLLELSFEDYQNIQEVYIGKMKGMREFLVKIFNFTMSEAELSRIDTCLQRLSQIDLEKGNVVARQDEVGESFYMIIQGEIEVQKISQGQLQTTSYLGRSQVFGDEILIYPTYKFRYTVSSLEINLLVFTKQNFFYFPEKCKSYLVQLVNQKIEARESRLQHLKSLHQSKIDHKSQSIYHLDGFDDFSQNLRSLTVYQKSSKTLRKVQSQNSSLVNIPYIVQSQSSIGQKQQKIEDGPYGFYFENDEKLQKQIKIHYMMKKQCSQKQPNYLGSTGSIVESLKKNLKGRRKRKRREVEVEVEVEMVRSVGKSMKAKNQDLIRDGAVRNLEQVLKVQQLISAESAQKSQTSKFFFISPKKSISHQNKSLFRSY